jgi:hypothetical protein
VNPDCCEWRATDLYARDLSVVRLYFFSTIVILSETVIGWERGKNI